MEPFECIPRSGRAGSPGSSSLHCCCFVLLVCRCMSACDYVHEFMSACEYVHVCSGLRAQNPLELPDVGMLGTKLQSSAEVAVLLLAEFSPTLLGCVSWFLSACSAQHLQPQWRWVSNWQALPSPNTCHCLKGLSRPLKRCVGVRIALRGDRDSLTVWVCQDRLRPEIQLGEL